MRGAGLGVEAVAPEFVHFAGTMTKGSSMRGK
ncbi:hypothetical protein M973_09995 [Francisella orientalis LADL 07-285A]|nr:hypothetical protein M973_09995 [Francisella orientalis LADL 07-285A]